MRKLIVLTVVLGVASTVAAAPADCGCAPTLAQISGFEERVSDLPEPIYHYARYYAGVVLPAMTFRGQTVIPRRILAEFIPLKPDEPTAIHIVELRDLPPLHDEACVAHLDVPPENDAFQLVPRCNSPGGWTPDAAGIAELERRLQLPPGADALDRYVRHYAGVTESGTRLIRGVFIERAGAAPAIVVQSEIELPLVPEDGCRVLDVRYNPETTLSSVYCDQKDR